MLSLFVQENYVSQHSSHVEVLFQHGDALQKQEQDQFPPDARMWYSTADRMGWRIGTGMEDPEFI